VRKLMERWRAAALAREDEEATVAATAGVLAGVRNVVAVALSLFILYTAGFGEFTATLQRAVPLLAAALLIFIVFPGRFRALDALWAAGAVFALGYLILFHADIAERIGWETNWDYTAGVVGTIVVIEIARRTTGWALPILAVVFLLYALFGDTLPGILGHPNLSLGRVVRYTWLSQEGIFGLPLGAVASFVFLYILYSTFLAETGAGQVFTDLAYALTGRMRSGPAQTAVVSSMLFGSINGSSAANVVGTGTFTIPLMRRMGYDRAFAGGVEAAASTGGQIMPPIMGAAAFIMAEVLGVPYATVISAALIPALLYYVALSTAVHFEALRLGVRGGVGEALPEVVATLRKGMPFFVSLAALLYMLFGGYSTGYAGFAATLALMAACMLQSDLRRRILPIVWNGLIRAAVVSLQIWAAVAVVGIIIAVVTMTGLGPHFAEIVSSAADHSLLLALICTMLACIVLGMGLPTVACYLLLAVLVAPAIVKLGVPPLAAHLFVLYFGAISSITPPVAIAAFAAAGIAQAGAMRIALHATRLALPGFIIPFLFVLSPVLVMRGEPLEIVLAAFSATIGVVALSASTIGWFFGRLPIPLRLLLFAAAMGLLVPGWLSDVLGLATLAACIVVQRLLQSRSIPVIGNDGAPPASHP